jgi:hypothetical protein
LESRIARTVIVVSLKPIAPFGERDLCFVRVFNQQLSADLVAAHRASTGYWSTFACLCLASQGSNDE